MLLFSGVFGVVIVAILPETPKYLVAKGDYEKASLSVRFYFGKSAHLGDSLKSIERVSTSFFRNYIFCCFYQCFMFVNVFISKDVGEASTSEVRLVDLFAIPHLRAALKLFLASLQARGKLLDLLHATINDFSEHCGAMDNSVLVNLLPRTCRCRTFLGAVVELCYGWGVPSWNNCWSHSD